MATGREIASVKKGDVGSTFNVTLYSGRDVVDLTSAVAARLHIADQYGNEFIDTAISFLDREAGSVTYTWTAQDMTDLGEPRTDLLYEVEVEFPGSVFLTYPDDRAGFPFHIVRELS